jgi:hypothetical protein
MNKFPRTQIENLSVSRMIIGTNWFLGYSHTSAAKDSQIKAVMTPARIADVIEVFVTAGVDTLMGPFDNQTLREGVEEARQRTGKKLIAVSTPWINPKDGEDAFAESRKIIARHASFGADICMPHTSATDAMVDVNGRKIRGMDRICKEIRSHGMIPGLSTHMPEAIVYADETDLDVGTYISLYNAAGFLMHIEVDWVHKLIWKAKHPVITIKPLAAGRLLPLVGLGFAWATLRPQDMVTVGTMSPDEAKELIEISVSILERRADGVELQSTRSKQTVTGKKPSVQPYPVAPN